MTSLHSAWGDSIWSMYFLKRRYYYSINNYSIRNLFPDVSFCIVIHIFSLAEGPIFIPTSDFIFTIPFIISDVYFFMFSDFDVPRYYFCYLDIVPCCCDVLVHIDWYFRTYYRKRCRLIYRHFSGKEIKLKMNVK